MVLDPRGFKTTIFCGIGMILVGLAVVALGYFGALEDKQIKESGTETPAAIVDKVKEVDDEDHTTYSLKLVFFDSQTKRHEASRSVDRSLFDEKKVGDTIAVKYLEAKPDKVRLASEVNGDPMTLLYALGAIGGVLVLSGFGCFIYARINRPGGGSIVSP